MFPWHICGGSRWVSEVRYSRSWDCDVRADQVASDGVTLPTLCLSTLEQASSLPRGIKLQALGSLHGRKCTYMYIVCVPSVGPP